MAIHVIKLKVYYDEPNGGYGTEEWLYERVEQAIRMGLLRKPGDNSGVDRYDLSVVCLGDTDEPDDSDEIPPSFGESRWGEAEELGFPWNLHPGDEIKVRGRGPFRIAEIKYIGTLGDDDCIIVVTREDGVKHKLYPHEIG